MNEPSFSRFATSRPQTLLFDWRFWIKFQRKTLFIGLGFLVAFVVLVLIGVTPLRGFEHVLSLHWKQHEASSLLIQILIFFVGMVAFGMGANFLARLTVERAISEEITRVGDALKADMRNGIRSLDLDKVQDLWPDNASPGLIPLRMCAAIQDDASDNYFGSKDALLQQYRDESFARLSMIQGMQRAALHLGILGTFLGLLFAMPELVSLGQGEFNRSTFDSLFSSLKVGFSTSIAGLVGSLFIGLLCNALFRQQEGFFERLDGAASAVLGVVRNALNRTHVAKTLERLGHDISALHNVVYSQNQQVRAQTEAIERGMQDLKLARTNLDSFLNGVETLKEHVITQVDAISNRISSGNYLERVDQELSTTLKHIADRVDNSVHGALKTLDASRSALDKAAQSLSSSGEALKSHVDAHSKETQRVVEAYQILDQSVGTRFDHMSQTVAAKFGNLGDNVNAKLTDTGAIVTTKLDSVFDEITKALAEVITRSISTHDRLAALHQGQTASLEKMIDHHHKMIESVLGFEERQREQGEAFLARLRKYHMGEQILEVLRTGNSNINQTLRQGFESFREGVRSLGANDELVGAIRGLNEAAIRMSRSVDGRNDARETVVAPPVSNPTDENGSWLPKWLRRKKPK